MIAELSDYSVNCSYQWSPIHHTTPEPKKDLPHERIPLKRTKKDAGENKEITKEKRVKLESPKLLQKLNQRFKIKSGRHAKKESSLLSVDDKKELDGDEWFTDRHINALNKLLLSKYPSQNGLTCPLILDEYKKYQASPENFVQIVNMSRKHWVCASNIFSSSGIVDIYEACHASPLNLSH